MVSGGSDVSALYATSGAARLVVKHTNESLELWDTATMMPLRVLDHPVAGTDVEGAISADGSMLVLSGCGATKERPKERCAMLYNGDGTRRAQLTARHTLAEFTFSPNGKYLIAAVSDDSGAGLTLFETEHGTAILSRPAWRKVPNMHSAIPSDLASFVGSQFVLAHGERVEVFDLDTRKTIAMQRFPGMTEQALAPKTHSVAVLLGATNTVKVWDFETQAIQTIQLGSSRHGSCEHCVLEVDDTDEDRLWVSPLYGQERYELRVKSRSVQEVVHEPRDTQAMRAPSTMRPTVARDSKSCILKVSNETELPLPKEFCEFSTYGNLVWPIPGFSPSKKHFASLRVEDQLFIAETASGQTTHMIGVKPR
jgi:WD40 repeat protein